MALKLVYSDYRVLAAAGSQTEYVYRLNSIFDPDFTGVGGQPDGYDLWSPMYAQYRVVACDVEVMAAALAGSALVSMAPSASSGSFLSAEELAGFAHARSSVANLSGQVAKLKYRYRMSALGGLGDASLLSESDWAAAIGGNPNQTQYLHVAAETSGTTDSVMVWTKLTYYVRLERKITTLDSLAAHGLRFRAALPPAVPAPPPVTSSVPVLPSSVVRQNCTGVARR